MALIIPENPQIGDTITTTLGTFEFDGVGWVVPQIEGGEGVPEAPIDGKQYARKDADWEEVAASGDVNVIESISMNGVAFNVDVNKDVDITHDHSGESINPDNIILDKTYTNAEAESLAVGAIFYNVDQLNWMLKLSDVNYYNFGEELPVLSRIGDDQNHLEGQAGYISGGATQLNNISLASSVTGVVNCLATQDVLVAEHKN